MPTSGQTGNARPEPPDRRALHSPLRLREVFPPVIVLRQHEDYRYGWPIVSHANQSAMEWFDDVSENEGGGGSRRSGGPAE